MRDRDEGVARLESALAGTRLNAARALRELHAAMWRDLRRAERRAERAERRAEELAAELRLLRRRLRRAERCSAAPVPADASLRRLPSRGLRRVARRLARARRR